MLTVLQRRILNASEPFANQMVNLDYLAEKIPDVPRQTIVFACEDLDKQGYFEMFSNGMGNDARFMLSYLGQTYKEQRWLTVRKFIAESVCTPIAVSFLTTALTIWLKLL